ncbi:MAG: ribosome assembly RNA-binding protein YhbY [Gammaproteobacteria bacterium]|nr:ribosome assembly RNA-binding protein YhbY [Gammaproteobacteria bacterium]
MKKTLKQKAHKLHPIVIVGSNGLSDTVLNEIERALFDHELIKIKIVSSDREERKEVAQQICNHSQAELIQSIGKVIVIYRQRPEITH